MLLNTEFDCQTKAIIIVVIAAGYICAVSAVLQNSHDLELITADVNCRKLQCHDQTGQVTSLSHSFRYSLIVDANAAKNLNSWLEKKTYYYLFIITFIFKV